MDKAENCVRLTELQTGDIFRLAKDVDVGFLPGHIWTPSFYMKVGLDTCGDGTLSHDMEQVRCVGLKRGAPGYAMDLTTVVVKLDTADMDLSDLDLRHTPTRLSGH